MTALAREEIFRLMKSAKPLLENYPDLENQLQPNGFDLSLKQVRTLEGEGVLPTDNARRKLPSNNPLEFDCNNQIKLMPGIYSVVYNEVVNIPKDIMALATPRSSLLRSGCTVNTAVWDAGYSGRSESLLVVYNPAGLILERNTRLIQLVFFKLNAETGGYCGIYQNENKS
ncbi:deoxyuridine 5'-triphosphate nucleotidohydrolase [Dehalococcoides mccartyi CG4]|uniref:deoxyuridine 5'-triphosphate nucleotidohydrolase n=1 Tax=Dehalococcoides mccartyi TaxID=61435 RepID=UPI0004E06B5D|nr:deoxyuridine 5'-triphosphate nucleotidohydrolase [Dehalococcoides mccartyi]AII59104.1 deoxyuridine 5'-triphosphate nucleotidohydrolase [Dehalococcoides mccartyi CG4]